jgi:hypothetical protein
MFEKKPPVESSVGVNIDVKTIPSEFYAGTNPVVKFKDVEKEIDPLNEPGAKISKNDKKLLDKETVVGGSEPLHPANLFASKKFLFIGAFLVFIISIGGGTLYYFVFDKKSNNNTNKNIVTIPTSSASKVNNSETSSTVFNNSNNNTVDTNTTSTVSTEPFIQFPSILLSLSSDSDGDGLTDKEEEVFGTDPGVKDTDGDGYSDSHELFYLYNPSGKEPMRLIDSSLVKEFKNDGFEYSVYYPSNWALGDVKSDGSDVLFSTITGENIEARVFDKNSGDDFSAWFSKWAPGEKFSDLVHFESYFKTKGWKRNDSLVYYFVTDSRVYVLVYHPSINSSVVNYPHVLEVMARSFQFLNPNLQAKTEPTITSTSTSSTIEKNIVTSTKSGLKTPAIPTVSTTSSTNSSTRPR